jgi:hypothetical protein
VAVQRRWQISSRFVPVVVIAVALVGGLIIFAVVQGSKSSDTSTPISTSTATTSALPTPAQPPGPNDTIADYLKKNNIQETAITQGTPGAPRIDIPVPEGWKPIPEGADAQYFGIVFNTPTNPDDPPKITATVEKLTGIVDPDTLLAVAPREVKKLPGFTGSDCIKSTMSGHPACQLGGSYTKDGVMRAVAQKTVIIPRDDGTYVLQVDAGGLQDDIAALNAAATVIDEKTTITP